MYIGGSLTLIVVAIVFSAIVNNVKDSQSGSNDIRSRANAPSLVKVEGVVSQINDTEETIVVDNLHFEKGTKNLGAWTITTPPRLNFDSLTIGTRIVILVDPPTMTAATKSLTAKEITIVK